LGQRKTDIAKAGESFDVGHILTSPDLLGRVGLPARRQDMTTLAQTRKDIQHDEVIGYRAAVAIDFTEPVS